MITRFEITDPPEAQQLINNTALRNMLIRVFWEGLRYTRLSYKGKFKLVNAKFNVSAKTFERIINNP